MSTQSTQRLPCCGYPSNADTCGTATSAVRSTPPQVLVPPVRPHARQLAACAAQGAQPVLPLAAALVRSYSVEPRRVSAARCHRRRVPAGCGMLTSAARGRPTHRIVRWDSQRWVWRGESVGVSPQASIPAVVLTTVPQATRVAVSSGSHAAVQCSGPPVCSGAIFEEESSRECRTAQACRLTWLRVSYSRRPDSAKPAVEARATVAGSLLHSTKSLGRRFRGRLASRGRSSSALLDLVAGWLDVLQVRQISDTCLGRQG